MGAAHKRRVLAENNFFLRPRQAFEFYGLIIPLEA